MVHAHRNAPDEVSRALLHMAENDPRHFFDLTGRIICDLKKCYEDPLCNDMNFLEWALLMLPTMHATYVEPGSLARTVAD